MSRKSWWKSIPICLTAVTLSPISTAWYEQYWWVNTIRYSKWNAPVPEGEAKPLPDQAVATERLITFYPSPRTTHILSRCSHREIVPILLSKRHLLWINYSTAAPFCKAIPHKGQSKYDQSRTNKKGKILVI